jgi:hypothetical protein
MITNKKWHEMSNYSKLKIIVHLVEKINKIKINDFDLISTINQCETYVLIKTHEIISRQQK